MFDVTGDDIVSLSDADLRILVGRLCEADFSSAGLPLAGIAYGGNQDAPDGGLDVVVRGQHVLPNGSFVPRGHTGFQVKKPKMPPAKIVGEMKPNGEVREAIEELISSNGAYIIVSSGENLTESQLRDRIAAMREALGDEKAEKIVLDFYDRERLATWVRSHKSLVFWVRRKVGRALTGWRPYENWARIPEGEGYLADGQARIFDGTSQNSSEMAVLEGINKLRRILSVPTKCVRLTGLSGVGKTRLVHALFDERVGEAALNPFLAFYTDISDDDAAPDPRTFAENLIANDTRAIMIVDNCNPQLHRSLMNVCTQSDSKVSLLTVEYDIREDLPEETEVFRLEPASAQVIERLLGLRYSHISNVDRQSIAEFSGGNARLAIALANTVRRDETVSGLREEELFRRLFEQRHQPNDELLKAAEVCSLVYSFEGMDVVTEKSELNFLAELAGQSGVEMYRHVQELRNRDLVQARGVWRAVMPHAIANRLARQALRKYSRHSLLLFLNSERLAKSFARRLSYLHDCVEAKEIVEDWMSPTGFLGQANCNFNAFGIEVFKSAAPVSPDKALEVIESAAHGEDGPWFTTRDNPHYATFVRLLRQIAYDASLFDRCVEVLCRFALSEDPAENNNSSRDVLRSLFFLYLSGTQASLEQRSNVIRTLVGSQEEDKFDLALYLLGACLEASHFSCSYQFSFGARSRGYGYEPNTADEIEEWYLTFLELITELAISEGEVSRKARKLLADRLRGLWTKAGVADALLDAARRIHENEPWSEGWIAVRGIIRYDGKELDEDNRTKLYALEEVLRPANLLSKARAFALSDRHYAFDLDDDFDDQTEDISSGMRRAEETTEEIGASVVQDGQIFKKLLPDIVSADNARLFSFGKGLAKGSEERDEIWNTIRSQLDATDQQKRNPRVLVGFLAYCLEHDEPFYQAKLDEILNDTLLRQWFVHFQTSAKIDERGIERLKVATKINDIPVWTFQYLGWGRSHEAIPDNDLAVMMCNLMSRSDDYWVVFEVLSMRYHGEAQDIEIDADLLAAGREALSKLDFSNLNHRPDLFDYRVAEVAKRLLDAETAKAICRNIVKSVDSRISSRATEFRRLLHVLAEKEPKAMLDELLESELPDYKKESLFTSYFDRHDNPLNSVPDDILIAWCGASQSRWLLVAESIDLFDKDRDTNEPKWRPITYELLEKSPHLRDLLDLLAESIIPMGWSGSRADILQGRLTLFDRLLVHPNPEVQSWARDQKTMLQERIRQERHWEDNEKRSISDSFE